jgi:hypothetical protein
MIDFLVNGSCHVFLWLYPLAFRGSSMENGTWGTAQEGF